MTQFGPTAEINRKPFDLTSAKVFSDPPINVAPITKEGDVARLGDGTSWTLAGAAAGLRDGRYTVAIRPNYVSPISGKGVELKGTVLVTELSGSDSSAHFRMGEDAWVSLAPGVHAYRVGETRAFYMDASHCYYFAPDGARVA